MPTPTHNWGGDFAQYIHQAEAIANGNVQQFSELNMYALEHSSYSTFGPEYYPWGWPAFLSPIVKFIGVDYIWMKILVLFFFFGCGYMFFKLVSKRIGIFGGVVCGLVFLCNPWLIGYTDNVLSEFPFLFFFLLSLLLSYKHRDIKNLWKSAVLAVTLFIAFTIRTEGVLLAAAIYGSRFLILTIRSLKNRCMPKYELLIMSYELLIYALLLAGYHFLAPNGNSSHMKHFELGFHPLSNLFYYLKAIPDFMGRYVNGVIFLSVLPFYFYGLVKRATKDIEIVLFHILMVALLLVWPHREYRYLIPVVPFVFYFIYCGMSRLRSTTVFRLRSATTPRLRSVTWLLRRLPSGVEVRAEAPLKISLATIIFPILIVLIATESIEKISEPVYHEVEGPETPDAKEMFEFVRNKTGKKDVIVFFKPRVMSLYTKRKSCLVNCNLEKLQKEADYVVVHKYYGGYNQLETLIHEAPKWLNKCFENRRFVVYKKGKLNNYEL